MVVGWFSCIVEMGIGFVMRKWRTEVGEDAEDGLLLPVQAQQREDGDIGRRWMAKEVRG